KCGLACALDRDDCISGARRIELRLLDAATLSSRRTQKSSRERAYQSAHPKRYSQRANCGIDLALGVATPIERRLLENDPDFGGKHRPADYSPSSTGQRHDPVRS